MNKVYIVVLSLILLGLSTKVMSQSNPRMDRPVKQCILDHKASIENLPETFSIGFWLGKLVETVDKLQKTTGKGGGPMIHSILEKEKDLDDLIILSEKCTALSDEVVVKNLKEMKAFYQEKKEETYDRNDGATNLFGEKSTITTSSLPRSAAKEIRKRALNIRKVLEKKYK